MGWDTVQEEEIQAVLLSCCCPSVAGLASLAEILYLIKLLRDIGATSRPEAANLLFEIPIWRANKTSLCFWQALN